MSVRDALCAAVLAGTAVAAAPAAADIWKRVDPRGVVHYSDRHLGPGSVLVMRTRRGPAGRGGATAARLARDRARYTPIIERTARRFALDARLVHAVVRAESAYDADAESRKGAVGLMQLMPGTAARYGVSDRRDPAQNVAGGVRYLRDLLLQFRNVTLALAAYNAGENAVARHGNRVPPFPETRAYVARVIRFYRELRAAS